MSGDGDHARPWWASRPDVSVAADDPDPLVRHREARRGEATTPDDVPGDARDAGPGPGRDVPSWWAAASDVVDRLGEDLADGARANAASAARRDERDDPAAPPPWEGRTDDRAGSGVHDLDVCGVCPVCLAVRAIAESRPELAAHLLEAGRQLTLAVRALVDRPRDRPAADDPGDGRTHDRADDPAGDAAADSDEAPAGGPATGRAPLARTPPRTPLTRIDLDQDGP